MNFQKRLDVLLAAGKAYKTYGIGITTVVEVPMGKYLGAYTRCIGVGAKVDADGLHYAYWAPSTRIDSLRYFKKSSFHIPNRMGFHRRMDRQRQEKPRYQKWKETGASKFLIEMEPLVSHISKTTGVFNADVLRFLLCLTGTRMLAAYSEHSLRFTHNFASLTNVSILLGTRTQVRWRLIHLCYKMDWRKAAKIVFPKVHPQVINSCDTLQSFLYYARRKSQTVHRAKEAGDIVAHESWKQNRYFFEVIGFRHFTKKIYLNYYRRWGSLNASGSVGHFIEYVRELQRAWELGICLDMRFEVVEPAEARRRHTIITNAIVLEQERRQNQTIQQYEEAHKSNWENLNYPSSWRPMLTKQDFEYEGQAMHHCVGSYFNKTTDMFAAIEKDGERATVQWRWEWVPSYKGTPARATHRIVQLHGVCNSEVSENMRNYVQSILRNIAAKQNGDNYLIAHS